ncbi:MAG: hypothetical protein KOO60_12400 [Gemmatimonadales bacterium]|nr:hypothetical protein [Gemmatimonadales bacterium]
MNGVFGARGNHQEGRSGAFAYSADNLHLTSSLDERIRVTPDLSLRLGFLSTWESRDSRIGSATTEFDKWIRRPQLSLSYITSPFRVGWSWYGLRTEQKVQGLTTYQDDRFDNSVWANLDLGRGKIETRWQGGSVEREETVGLQENSDNLWHTSAQYRLSDSDQFQYAYSRSSNHAVTLGSRSIYDRHSLEYQGARRFAGGRGRVALTTRSNFFRQQTIKAVAGSWDYLEPDWTGYQLDDTPEFRDPLEAEPVLVVGLSDNDLDSSSGINIGDAAQQVREFGGDYRNIIYDFGDPEEIVAANLYIDVPLGLPGLVQWMVFVNDDPDGREWGTALGEDQVRVVYREWANGRQGWEIRFPDPVTHRRLKLVNIKLGPTEPDIFVTELEVFRPVSAQQLKSESASHRHRISGTAGYQVNPDLNFSYGVTVDLRRFEVEGRNSTRAGHVAGFDWRTRGWVLAAKYQDSRRWRESNTDTDINSQTLSLTPVIKGEFHTRLSAGRSQDSSQGRDHSTINLSSDSTWDAAPQLSFSQRVGYGLRRDLIQDIRSHSIALVTRMRSAPRRTLRVDLMHRDRWVSREAGYGFMTFNDTEGLVAWSITTQIAASSRIRYQVREEGEWVLRHFLSWSPVPGGKLEMRLYLNGFRDTRNDSSQRGQGISVTWHPRSRLYLEGGYNASEFSQGDEESSPVNVHFRGTWSF